MDGSVDDRQWFIVDRWQRFEGEARANVLRIVSLGAFYAIELMNARGLELGFLSIPKIEDVNHRAITLLCVAWTLLAVAILVCLRRRIFPPSLPYISTFCDLVLLTSVLTVAGGARSPMVVGYFLIIALSTLRFSLPLIWFATAGSMIGYFCLLGCDRWFRDPPTSLPRYHQLTVLLALLLLGVMLGQVVRRVRKAADEYAARLAGKGGDA